MVAEASDGILVGGVHPAQRLGSARDDHLGLTGVATAWPSSTSHRLRSRPSACAELAR